MKHKVTKNVNTQVKYLIGVNVTVYMWKMSFLMLKNSQQNYSSDYFLVLNPVQLLLNYYSFIKGQNAGQKQPSFVHILDA